MLTVRIKFLAKYRFWTIHMKKIEFIPEASCKSALSVPKWVLTHALDFCPVGEANHVKVSII